ncbi:hypothetical protein LX81_00248 [Palleronia aestuarii]|uniref:TNase-like domain-containing protein n=1 Tax=Palleronia aestuarii TaxID=568105 RepID=A0A2W7P2Y3_9RHOB|nr:thermonuclease family protein [Palleronia aestuarii]PZX19786.1 hypothetical protein LX81_00248 [Palleronia aestuarii]
MLTRLAIIALLALTACDDADTDHDTIRVTADMIVDGDTVRIADGPNIRLTGEGNDPFDTPETYKPGCTEEAQLGAQASALLRSLMPGEAQIIRRGGGGFGRDLGVLYGNDGEDVKVALLAAGLARESMNADWCGGS